MSRTKTIFSFEIMRSETWRSSKLMIAAMRSRSLLLKMLFGVRWRTPMNSSRVFGVYLGAVVGVFGSRNLSSLGSRNLTIFLQKLNHMI